MTMITPSYLGETIEYSSLHACRSTLEDPTTCLLQLVNWVILPVHGEDVPRKDLAAFDEVAAPKW